MEPLKRSAGTYSRDQDVHGKLLDMDLRDRKAEKIRAVLRDIGVLRPETSILDLGCSHGYILKNLAHDAGFCVGVDIDRETARLGAPNIAYVLADGERLPFKAGTFDIVVCNHVYEHTDAPAAMLAEIRRLLKADGVCYFAGPNKFSLVEPHYQLPFLSWLPGALADRYVRMAGKGDAYLVRPYSYRRLCVLLAPFLVEDYTPRIINQPALFHIDDLLKPGSAMQWLAKLAYRFCRWLFPTFIFVLRPRSGD